jgi:hypothetical protein
MNRKDDQAVVCETMADASALARAMAAELGGNREASEIEGRYVRVTDEEGREVYRTPVVDQKRKVQAEDLWKAPH